MTNRQLPSAVLFACTQNAVRSPMAEGYLKHLHGTRIYVDSVGLRSGHEVDPFAIEVMREIGIDLTRHRHKAFDTLADASFDVVVTLSHAGYVKTVALSEYQAQRRGGRGKAATSIKDEDFVETLFTASTHDSLLFFTDAGKVYWLKVYELPVASRVSRGRPFVNLLPLADGEKINAMLPVRHFDEGVAVEFTVVHSEDTLQRMFS